MSDEEKNPDLCSNEHKEHLATQRENWALQKFVKNVYEARSKEDGFPEAGNPIDDFLIRNTEYISRI